MDACETVICLLSMNFNPDCVLPILHMFFIQADTDAARGKVLELEAAALSLRTKASYRHQQNDFVLN